MLSDLRKWMRADLRKPAADAWGSRGRRFKSCQPDSETAGQRRVAREGRLASCMTTATRPEGQQRSPAERLVEPVGRLTLLGGTDVAVMSAVMAYDE